MSAEDGIRSEIEKGQNSPREEVKPDKLNEALSPSYPPSERIMAEIDATHAL